MGGRTLLRFAIGAVLAVGLSASAQAQTDFTRGVNYVSSTSALAWFTPSGFTAGYVILHYTPAGQAQQNVNMTWNAGSGRWEYTMTGLTSGQVVTYSFSYQKNGTQFDSASFSYTHTASTTATYTATARATATSTATSSARATATATARATATATSGGTPGGGCVGCTHPRL